MDREQLINDAAEKLKLAMEPVSTNDLDHGDAYRLDPHVYLDMGHDLRILREAFIQNTMLENLRYRRLLEATRSMFALLEHLAR